MRSGWPVKFEATPIVDMDGFGVFCVCGKAAPFASSAFDSEEMGGGGIERPATLDSGSELVITGAVLVA